MSSTQSNDSFVCPPDSPGSSVSSRLQVSESDDFTDSKVLEMSWLDLCGKVLKTVIFLCILYIALCRDPSFGQIN